MPAGRRARESKGRSAEVEEESNGTSFLKKVRRRTRRMAVSANSLLVGGAMDCMDGERKAASAFAGLLLVKVRRAMCDRRVTDALRVVEQT